MSESDAKNRFAWEPITPPGVAAFAGASLPRLLLVQLVFAVLAATVICWFLWSAWCPAISAAIDQLPQRGEIREGTLEAPINSPQVLADGHFLAFIVDRQHEGQLRSPANLQFEFGSKDVYVFSLFGYQQWAYPRGWIIAFNRAELKPKWEAWRPAILAGAFCSVVVGLMLIWAALATIYMFPVAFVSLFANRRIGRWSAWKLAGAAMLPGAVLLTAAIFAYGLGWLDLVQLIAAFVAHFVIEWIYVAIAPLFAPKIELAAGKKKNPFRTAVITKEKPGNDVS